MSSVMVQIEKPFRAGGAALPYQISSGERVVIISSAISLTFRTLEDMAEFAQLIHGAVMTAKAEEEKERG